MYVQSTSLAVAPVAATVATPFILPNTGSSSLVTIAISIALGMIVWGSLYAFLNRNASTRA